MTKEEALFNWLVMFGTDWVYNFHAINQLIGVNMKYELYDDGYIELALTNGEFPGGYKLTAKAFALLEGKADGQERKTT